MVRRVTAYTREVPGGPGFPGTSHLGSKADANGWRNPSGEEIQGIQLPPKG